MNGSAITLASWRAAFETLAEAEKSGRPVRERNRLHDLVRREAAELAGSERARVAIERLARDESDLALRLAATLALEQWDAVAAAHALEQIVQVSGGSVTRPMTMTSALAVGHRVGKIAALCLFNLDQGKGNVAASPTTVSPQEPVRVSNGLLDAAESVHALVMNGGLDHAFHLVGNQFSDAALCLVLLGDETAAEVLRAALTLFPTDVVASDPDTRNLALAALSLADVERMEHLNANYMDCAAVEEHLDSAASD